MAEAPVGVTLQGPPNSLASLAVRLEASGIASLWTGDYFQSGVVRAALLAAATTRSQVGTHVLQAFARSPLATALAAQELQVLTGGRFVLGLGSQVTEANRRWHGAAVDRPVAALREYIRAVQTLLDTPGDATAEFTGKRFAYRVPPFRPAAQVPRTRIWVGGAGTATVGLAAEVADGLAGHMLWTYGYVRHRIRPRVGALPVTVARLVAPNTVPGARIGAFRRLAHYLVTPAYQGVLEQQGVAIDRTRLLAAIRAQDDVAIVRLVGPYADNWCLHDAEELARHRALAAAHGVDQLMLLVPADPAYPARTACYEQGLAQLLTEAGSDAS
jgi:luciferase-like monooxygenase